ncbi:MAG: integrase arm-type DNA-binding domain-containing protein [Gammaproteobacteria bacterium]|nr:integrase arm-type DNA-binding domain-containing protein [Gammaproteobacteria bacterium]MDP6733791.1 integrase arm-type DNA-binding domain-containing protein [Gammaproteobacteria bacterium]|tara:strand:- start:1423 stop:2730 length:1308 start_codon:yes stop_codon:yes gene_type:complete
MPKKAKILSDVHVRRLKHNVTASGVPRATRYPVGGVSGLYLQCSPPSGSNEAGAKSWILRTLVGGKRRDIGLGSYDRVPLKKARELATETKADIKAGIDPVAEAKSNKSSLKEQQAQEITFKQYAAAYIIQRGKEYKTPQQVRRLQQQLRDYAYPHIGHLLIRDINRGHLIRMLNTFYEEKTETATRVINHVEKIIQRAIIEGIRTDANPAIWQGNLALAFASPSKIAPRKNQRAIDWRLLPDFMKALVAYDTPAGSHPEALCFAFMILTVSRPSEARLVEWSDIDLELKVWTLPPDKVGHKSKKEWKVPLCPQAIKILKAQPDKKGLVFKTHSKKEIPNAYLSPLPDALGFDAVAHGFRTTFRTWGQEQQRFTEEVLELCMKHVDTDATRAAYARSQLFDERKKVLTEYSKWAINGVSLNVSKVVPLAKRQRAS